MAVRRKQHLGATDREDFSESIVDENDSPNRSDDRGSVTLDLLRLPPSQTARFLSGRPKNLRPSPPANRSHSHLRQSLPRYFPARLRHERASRSPRRTFRPAPPRPQLRLSPPPQIPLPLSLSLS